MYRRNHIRLLCLCLCLSLTQVARAQSTKIYIEGGLHTGGDKIPSNEMEGGEVENSVEAGGLFSGSIGVFAPISDKMELITSFGMKYNSKGIFFDYSGNDSVTWTMYTFNLLGSYVIDEWRLSGGLTYHYAPVLQKNDLGLGRKWEFSDAAGLSLELGHIERGGKAWGIRLVLIEYESEGVSVNGNSIGFIYRYFFHD